MLSPTRAPRLLPVAWPMAVEFMLAIGIGIVGTALAAGGGDQAAAAFAVVNHVHAALFVLVRIVAIGVGVVVTQSLGAARADRAAALARSALALAGWIGAACALAVLLLPGPLLAAINAPPVLLPLATPYLMALAPALLLDALLATLAAVLRAHLLSRQVLGVIVAMHALHLLLAVLLMRGFGPLPPLGLHGFALALALARCAGAALLLALWRQRLAVRLAPRDWLLPARAELRAMLRIGLPGAAENIAWRAAYVVSIAVAGGLGAAAMATHAYASQASYVTIVFGLANGFAVEILVGHLVGAARLHDAHRLVRRALLRGIGIALAAALAMALAGPALMRLFTDDAAIAAAAVTLLWWTLLVEPGRTFNLVLVNALRAAGDVHFPVAAGALSMALVLAGGSWLLGSVAGLGLTGVWLAYAADEWLRGLVMWWRWRSLAWVPAARRARRAARGG